MKLPKLTFKLSRLYPFFYILLFGALLAGAGRAARSDFVKVRSISCKTQYGPCIPAEEERLQKFVGENILFLKTGEVRAAFGDYFLIREAYAQRVFPNKLAVFLERRKPLTAIETKGAEGVFLSDRDGVVLGFEKDSALPRLVIDNASGMTVGERAESNIIAASQLLYLTYKLGVVGDTLRGELVGDSLKIDLGGTAAYFDLAKDPRVSIGALQLILARAKVDGKLPKVADLRYSNPVLTY